MILSILSAVSSEAVRLFLELSFRYPGTALPRALMVVTLLACLGIGRYGYLLFKFSTPEKRMRQIGQAVADALAELGEIEEPQHCRVEVESAQGALISVALKGGTMRDKTTFAACMAEIWGVIDNPRYLLVKGRNPERAREFYAVPETFGKQKDRVYVYEKHIRKAMGRFQAVYYQNAPGAEGSLKSPDQILCEQESDRTAGQEGRQGKI